MQVYWDLHSTRFLVLAAAVLVISFIFTRIHRFLKHRQFARLHGCEPVTYCNYEPFLGLDRLYHFIRNRWDHNYLETSCKFQRHFNYTFGLKELLNNIILTTEPENIKTILSINFKHYGIGHRLEVFEPLLGRGIFDTDGDQWAISRALIRPNFTRDQVADLTSFENLIQDFFALIPRDGQTMVDLQPLFFRYTMDSATEFLFGQSVGSLRMNESDLGFSKAFNYSLQSIMVRGSLGPFNRFYRDRKAEECNRICREFAQQFVEEAIHTVRSEKDVDSKDPERKRQKYIFSHELARRTSEKRRITDELMNVLLAGRDTTASMLSNLFFMLAKHPAVWAKLRKEVISLEGRLPTYEELRGLKYLKCCMNESLRLHPVVPLNDREALQDTVLPVGGGKDHLSPVFIPKGTVVGYNVYAMHRRTDFYGPDAEEFRPERWEDGRLQPRWEYLPFNGGPRICVGQQYALTEVGYVTTRMAQEFETLESCDPGPWEESLTLTLCSRNGTKVCVRPA